jgi:ActR/RegA family two-component response regulator
MVIGSEGQPARLLLVDGNEALREACAGLFGADGWEVAQVASGEAAMAELSRQSFPVALVNVVLPDMGGFAVLSALRERDPTAEVILMTGVASLDSAVEAVRRGAYDYLCQPVTADNLVAAAAGALEAHVRKASAFRDGAAPYDTHASPAPPTPGFDALAALARQLPGTSSPEEALRRILRTGGELTAAESGAVFGFGGDKQTLYTVGAIGSLAPGLLGLELHATAGLVRDAFAAAGPAHAQDPNRRSGGGEDPLAALGVYSLLTCPVLSDGEVQGLLALFDRHETPFGGQEEAVAALLAVHAAQPLRTWRQDRVRELAARRLDGDEFVSFADVLRR